MQPATPPPPPEASMRPGRITPDNPAAVAAAVGDHAASMRPGRITPDNLAVVLLDMDGIEGFNEAGANYPG